MMDGDAAIKTKKGSRTDRVSSMRFSFNWVAINQHNAQILTSYSLINISQTH